MSEASCADNDECGARLCIAAWTKIDSGYTFSIKKQSGKFIYSFSISDPGLSGYGKGETIEEAIKNLEANLKMHRVD